jgi:hypothetical protein
MSVSTSGRKILIFANVFFVLGLFTTSAYLFVQNRDLNDQLKLSTEEKNKILVDEINKVFNLPDEDPVVDVVKDPEVLKDQYETFDSAEEGDYVLSFEKAKLNILYRQKENRVIKTANIETPMYIEIMGTKEGIAETEKKLSNFKEEIAVIKTESNEITQSFVYDVDSDQTQELDSIAELLDYEVGSTLPASITPGERTEIVIAVVADKLSPTPAPTETE